MLIIVIVNMILQHFGLDLIKVNENEIASLVEIVIELAVILVTFWKNNSFTDNAIKADELLKNLKDDK